MKQTVARPRTATGPRDRWYVADRGGHPVSVGYRIPGLAHAELEILRAGLRTQLRNARLNPDAVAGLLEGFTVRHIRIAALPDQPGPRQRS